MAAENALPALLLWLLPVAFVVHDAEEVLFLPGWLRRNRDFLTERFPALSRLVPHLEAVSPRRFAAMAAEELALLLVVTLYAQFTHDFFPWLALFLAFGVHLTVHVAQWIAVGRYVPVVATAPLCLLYCGWGLAVVIDSLLFTPGEFLLCGVAGCAVAAVNLLVMHRLAATCAKNHMEG